MIRPVIVIIAIFSFLPCGVCFSQPLNQTETAESVSIGLEEAIKKIEAQKEREHKKLASDLQAGLDVAVKDWFAEQENRRKKGLNEVVEQQWENLTEFGPRIHRTYYLRDFSYTLINMDIIKTESVVGAYKAVMNAEEKLFAERYHAPDVSYPEDFYYTVTTPVTVNFEYYNGRFVVSATEYGKSSIEQGWRK